MNIWVLENLRFLGEQNTRIGLAYSLAKKLGGSYVNIPEQGREQAATGDLVTQYGVPSIILSPFVPTDRDYELMAELKNLHKTHLVNIGRYVKRPELVGIYDTVVKPNHEELKPTTNYDLSTIVVSTGIPTQVNEEKLCAAADYWAPKFGNGNQPIYSLILGGDTLKGEDKVIFTEESMREMCRRVKKLVEGKDVFLAISDSPRTSETMIEIVNEELAGHIDLLHRVKSGNENPYLGLLALSRAIITTSESRSLMCDAAVVSTIPQLGEKAVLCYYPKFVYTVTGEDEPLDPKAQKMLADLYRLGCFRNLTEDTEVEKITSKGFDGSAHLAELIINRLSKLAVIENTGRPQNGFGSHR